VNGATTRMISHEATSLDNMSDVEKPLSKHHATLRFRSRSRKYSKKPRGNHEIDTPVAPVRADINVGSFD
jgi:hypothetical protein